MLFEVIIAVILLILMIMLLLKGTNINISVEYKYPEQKFVEVQDPYDEEGDPKNVDKDVMDFNETLKSIHAFMVDSEE